MIMSSLDRVEQPLGDGSFGTVVRAVDTATERIVAVKVLHKALMGSFRLHVEEGAYQRILRGCNSAMRCVVVSWI